VSHVNKEFNVIASDLEVVALTAPDKEMTDGAVVATVRIRRPLRRPDNQVRYYLSNFHVQNGYIENIELPDVGDQRSVLYVMEDLVKKVELLLQEFEAAGGDWSRGFGSPIVYSRLRPRIDENYRQRSRPVGP